MPFSGLLVDVCHPIDRRLIKTLGLDVRPNGWTRAGKTARY